MREILPGKLWLGNAFDARDLRRLCEQDIQAVVDLAVNEPPAQLGREMIYCRVPLVDGDGNGEPRITMAITCVAALVRGNFRTLVACSAGMSRSPAIAAVVVALLTSKLPTDCLLEVVAGFPHDVSPPLWAAVMAAYNNMIPGQGPAD